MLFAGRHVSGLGGERTSCFGTRACEAISPPRLRGPIEKAPACDDSRGKLKLAVRPFHIHPPEAACTARTTIEVATNAYRTAVLGLSCLGLSCLGLFMLLG